MSTPLVGYAIVWDSPGAPNRGRCFTYTRHCLDPWLTRGLSVPLQINHGPVFSSHGTIQQVGTVHSWRVDSYGLLCLGDLDDGITHSVDAGWLWGLSTSTDVFATDPPQATPHWSPLVRHFLPADVAILEATLAEVSLTDSPNNPLCRVLGTGDVALRLWDYPMLDQIALASVG